MGDKMKKIILILTTLLIAGCGGGGGGGGFNPNGIWEGDMFLLKNSCNFEQPDHYTTKYDIASDDNRTLAKETSYSLATQSFITTAILGGVAPQEKRIVVTEQTTAPCGFGKASRLVTVAMDFDGKRVEVVRERSYGPGCSNTPCSTTHIGELTRAK